ncbi:MAG: hypothetical protein ACM3SW_09305 [Actinomycetota bacterium]
MTDTGAKITDPGAAPTDAGDKVTDAGATTTGDEATIPSPEAKMTDAEILTLVDRLERCLLDRTELHHRDHLAVATAYLYAADFDSALSRMRATLLRFAAHHGVPNLYHETLTRFWMSEISRRLDRTLCLRESVARIQAALADKDLPFTYYRKETLNSPEAKKTFVEPDVTRRDLIAPA